MGSKDFTETSNNILRENFERIIPTLKGVTLLPVTKTVDTSKIIAAKNILESFGLPVIFGENYAQELLKKREEIDGAKFHFIGALQSNKIKSLIEAGAFIQSIASEKHLQIARKINKELDLFLQVNVSADPRKSGVSIDEAKRLLSLDFAPVRITGLMTILEETEDINKIRADYKKLAILGEGRLELSMGMSNDYKIAIEEGATMVRLGSVLFGDRG